MKELAKAIVNHFVSGPGAGSFTGIYHTIAPVTGVFPYMVFTIVSDVPDLTFTEKFESCLVQFDIYSDNQSFLEMSNLYNVLKTRFDYAEFVVDDYKVVFCERESSIPSRWEVEGKKVWDYTVTYRILLEKT